MELLLLGRHYSVFPGFYLTEAIIAVIVAMKAQFSEVR